MVMVDKETRIRYLLRLHEKGYPITRWQRQKFDEQFYAEEAHQERSQLVIAIRKIHDSIRRNTPPVFMSVEPLLSQLKKPCSEVIADYKRKKEETSNAMRMLSQTQPILPSSVTNNESTEIEEEIMIVQPETSQAESCLVETGIQTEEDATKNLEVQILEMEMDRDNLKELLELKEKENRKLREELEKKTGEIKKLEEKLEKADKDREEGNKMRSSELEKGMASLERQLQLYDIIVEDKKKLLELQQELMRERAKASSQLPNPSV